jgi:RHS repeat-associated protein
LWTERITEEQGLFRSFKRRCFFYPHIAVFPAASYVYNAVGQRVEGTTGGWVDYVYDQNGNATTLVNANGWARSELSAGGMHVATYANSITYFDHSDQLGSMRARTDVSGNVAVTCANLPFGDGLNCSGSDPSWLHFTGLQLDQESNLTHALFRQLSTTQGRWMMPDPAGMAAVDPTNPQSWNQYAYVMNNPINFIDLVGLECYAYDGHGNCTSWGTGGDGFGSFSGCGDWMMDASCSGGSSSYGNSGNLATMGGWGDPFQVSMVSSYIPMQPISTPIDAMRNEYGQAVSATIYASGFWGQILTGIAPINWGVDRGGGNNGEAQQPQQSKQAQPNPPQQMTCGGSLTVLGIGLGTTAAAGIGLVYAPELEPEIYEGAEGLLTLMHLLVPTTAPLLVLREGAVLAWQNCHGH